MLSRYLDFCLDLLVMYKNGLIRKIRLNSNFMKSQPGKQTMTIHILPNASINKGNQTIRFGQLREYITWETLFLNNHTQDVVEKLFPVLHLKNQNSAYLWISILKLYTVYFYWMSSWGPSKDIEIKLLTTCFHFI